MAPGVLGEISEEGFDPHQIGLDLAAVIGRENLGRYQRLLSRAQRDGAVGVAERNPHRGSQPGRRDLAAERAVQLLQHPRIDGPGSACAVLRTGVHRFGEGVGELGGGQPDE